MAIIPLSVAKRRLDTGNAVQYPQGSPIGGAMQGLGDAFSALVERHRQITRQQDGFDAELIRRKMIGQIAQAENDTARNAPADGSGLHDAIYGELDPRTGQAVKPGLFDAIFDSALRTVPADEQPAFAAGKEALRAAGSHRVAVRQQQRRRDYEHSQVTTVLETNASSIAQADPDDAITFEAARQDGLDLIDKMGVDPGIRQQLMKDWFGATAKARFEALIAKDPKRALAMFGVGAPAAGSETTGNGAQAAGSSFSGSPKIAGGKDDRVGTQTPDERIAQAFRDDLPQQEQEALVRKAKVAKLGQEIEIRAAIGRAEADAPDEIARTGAYSGKMPGKDAYRIIHGLDEGDRRRQDLEWRADVGKQIFDMGTMPNQAIHAALRDADSGPNGSQEDQAHHEPSAVAAKLVLERRRADAGGYVSELHPDIAAGWKTVFGTGPSDPEAYDQDNYDKTLAVSVAAQKALGIDDENLQPVPFSMLLKLLDDRDSGSMYFMDNYAKASELFARTKGPVARAALVRELDEAGLGGILPGGKPRLSVGEVVRSEAKALGKTAANAGIGAAEFLAKVGTLAADGNTQATLSPPDFSGAYYEPANNTEKVMMRQGRDALGWAIPVPGVGRAVAIARGIPRAIESVGSGVAGRAEGPIATKSLASPEGANNSIPETAPGQIGKIGAGQDTAAGIPAKPQAGSFSRQPTASLDDLYAVSPKWQAELEGAGREIADSVGAKFKSEGMKDKGEAARKIGRKRYKDASELTDIIRAGFVVKTPAQADEIVARLAQRYKILDEKWVGKDNDYFDRKVMVRFDDGTLGEVQMWEPNMYNAKFKHGGQDKYALSKTLTEASPELADLRAQEAVFYATARRDVDPIWRAVLAKLKGSASFRNSK
jgi:hypothetical protein